MNYWNALVDSLRAAYSNSVPLYGSNSNQNPNSLSNPSSDTMEVGLDGSSVSNERTAAKLKGYLNMGKAELSKAVTAEERCLVDVAVSHYRNAERILAEGAATRTPLFISSREQQKVNSYHQEISKWRAEVSERLQALNSGAGAGNPVQAATRPASAKVLPKTTSIVKCVQQRPAAFSRSSSLARNQADKSGTSKTSQDGRGYDAKLVEMINTVIVDRSPSVKWDDVAGLDKAKKTLFEMVILPTQRKDLFTGLRRPPRGLLLFGPPGNGKTMLAKAVASECNATFFNVSASTLTSKWVGEGEKLVRTLFNVAIERQPSVIFMDEIDSMMSTREAGEHDASRRLKSEFLVQFDGVTSNSNDLVIVIGATNKPQELDDAVLRRLVKRIYIPLPDENIRRLIFEQKLKGQAFSLPRQDLEKLVRDTEGYSGSDLQALCEEAALMPIRELGPKKVLTIKANQVRPLRFEDFQQAMTVIRPSLHRSRWEELERWNREFGSS